MPWGAAIAAAAAVGSAYMGSEAADDAAAQSRAGTDRAIGASTAADARTRADLSAYTRGGTSALQQLMYLTGVGNKPGTQFAPDAKTAFMTSDNKAFRSDTNDYLGRFGHGDRGGGSLEEIAPTWGVDRVVDNNGNVVWGKAYDQAPGAAADTMKGSLNKPFTLEDFQKDPSYNFRLQEGEKALSRAQSARGIAQGSPGLKALMRYNQDYASTEFGAAYSRDLSTKQNTFGMLQTLAGMGQNAAAVTGAGSMNAAGLQGAAAIAGGNASAAGIMGGASAQNNAIQGGLANYMYQQRYDQMMQRMPVFSPSGGTGTAPSSGGYAPIDT